MIAQKKINVLCVILPFPLTGIYSSGFLLANHAWHHYCGMGHEAAQARKCIQGGVRELGREGRVVYIFPHRNYNMKDMVFNELVRLT